MSNSTRRTRNTTKTSVNLPTACGYGMLTGLLAALIILPIATGIAYVQADPAKMAMPAALCALYLSVLCSGAAAAHKAENPLLAAGICGGLFLLVTLIFALFPLGSATCGFNTLVSVLTHLAVPATAMLGAFLGRRRTKHPSSRQRAHRRH